MTTRVDRAIARNMRRSYKCRQCTKERSGEGFEATVDVTSPAEAQEWATKLTQPRVIRRWVGPATWTASSARIAPNKTSRP